MPMGCKIDDARVARLTKEGWTAKAIAEHLGCGVRAVTRSRVRSGVARPSPRFLTPEEIDTVERLLADGASLREAARTIGRESGATLHRRFAGRGWTHQECGQFAMAIRYAGKSKS